MKIEQYDEIGKLIREIRSDHRMMIRNETDMKSNYEKLKSLLPGDDIPTLEEVLEEQDDSF